MSDERDRTDDPGFTVRDRRTFAATDPPPREDPPIAPSGAGERTDSASAERRAGRALPAIDFATFVISLSTSAMYHLGAIPDPDENVPKVNLPLAKQTIDIIGMLRDKTEGNRTPDETRLLDNLLYDLRLRYVDAVHKG